MPFRSGFLLTSLKQPGVPEKWRLPYHADLGRQFLLRLLATAFVRRRLARETLDTTPRPRRRGRSGRGPTTLMSSILTTREPS